MGAKVQNPVTCKMINASSMTGRVIMHFTSPKAKKKCAGVSKHSSPKKGSLKIHDDAGLDKLSADLAPVHHLGEPSMRVLSPNRIQFGLYKGNKLIRDFNARGPTLSFEAHSVVLATAAAFHGRNAATQPKWTEQ